MAAILSRGDELKIVLISIEQIFLLLVENSVTQILWAEDNLLKFILNYT